MLDNNNILLITSLYPSDDLKLLNDTAVCHYFAKEWVEIGYNVRVIHLYHTYPLIYYPLLKLANNLLASKTGHAILEKRITTEHSYEIDGIRVNRIPIKKNRPHGSFSEKTIKISFNRICEILDEDNYVPDYILGHFLHPSLEVITKLKKKYPHTVTSVSLHGEESIYQQKVASKLPSIDLVGYRSFPIKKAFERLYGEKPCFMCPSGVPDNFISEAKSFRNGIHRFVYVGSFIERKYPEVLLPAIHNAMNGLDVTITYVGSGKMEKLIRNTARKLNMMDVVRMTGRLSREQVTQELDKGDVFIMVSKIETFGLVYLEAMARGCIVIASKNEGMDGIIHDGVNGFLCEAGNSDELAAILTRIRMMSSEEQNALSEQSISTAKAYTDSIVAKKYIEALESFKQY